jgi:uncharacterized protein
MQNFTDNKSASRYELQVEGHTAIADYRLEGDRLAITHVEVPEALRGKGVAAQVMQGVVADATARNLTIVPVCSYAAAYMKRHA